jgi:flagellar biosynthesis GTPase FlhF
MSSDPTTANRKRHVSTLPSKQRARACLCGSIIVGALAGGALVSGTASAGTTPTAPYQISLAATPSSITTRQPITFTGTVSPAGAGERPRLRRLVDGQWMLLAVGAEVAASGGFSVAHTFQFPSRGGPTSLRICFPRTAFNLHTCSTWTVTITRSANPRPAHEKTVEERRKHRQEEARKRREETRQRHEARQHEREERRQRAKEERQQHQRERAEKRKQKLEEARQRREAKRRK